MCEAEKREGGLRGEKGGKESHDVVGIVRGMYTKVGKDRGKTLLNDSDHKSPRLSVICLLFFFSLSLFISISLGFLSFCPHGLMVTFFWSQSVS